MLKKKTKRLERLRLYRLLALKNRFLTSILKGSIRMKQTANILYDPINSKKLKKYAKNMTKCCIQTGGFKSIYIKYALSRHSINLLTKRQPLPHTSSI